MNYIVYHNPGSILICNKYFTDQLTPTITKINSSKIKWYLNQVYSLSQENYYKLVVGISSPPKCLKCNKDLNFISLSVEYYKTCNYSCHMSYTQKTLLKQGNHKCQLNPESYKEFQMKGTEKGLQKAIAASVLANKSLIEKGLHSFQNPINHMKGERSNFIKRFQGKICYLYIATSNKFPNLIKIGATSSKNRIGYPIDVRSDPNSYYNTIHFLREGDCNLIAELEYVIKVTLKDKLSKGTEWYHRKYLSDLLNQVKLN